MRTKICTTEIGREAWDKSVSLFMRNEITGAEDMKIYKNKSTAKRMATRFENRMILLYGDKVDWVMERKYR